MKKSIIIAGALLAFAGFPVAGAMAAGEQVTPPRQTWSFAGPFGTFDRAQLQRGFQVFREACSACHGLDKVSFRNLVQPGGPEFSVGQIEMLASEFTVTDGFDEFGDPAQRPARLADRWPNPFPNYAAAAAANGGKAPPDLSVMAKARTFERGFPWFITDVFTQYNENGVDYLAALLKGYVDPPEGFEVPVGGYYNLYYPGHVIAMPPILMDEMIEYPRDASGRPIVPMTVEQYSKDVAAFLMWTAEPHLEQRKSLGFQVILFLLVLSGLLYFTKKKIWARVGEADPKGAA